MKQHLLTPLVVALFGTILFIQGSHAQEVKTTPTLKWEYKIEDVGLADQPIGAASALAKELQQGEWEVVAVIPAHSHGTVIPGELPGHENVNHWSYLVLRRPAR